MPLIALFLLLVIFMPKRPKFAYDYRKGSPCMYETLIAQFDFPILMTEAQLQAEREKAGSNVIPYYKTDGKVAARSAGTVSALELGKWSDARVTLSDALAALYAKGILAPSMEQDIEEMLQDAGGLIYVQRDRRAEKVPVTEVFTVESASSYLRDAVAADFPQCDVDSLYVAASLGTLIVPDLVFDQQTTDLIHEESVNYVSATQGVVKAGQVIVSEGEMITAEIELLLDSYKSEYDTSVG